MPDRLRRPDNYLDLKRRIPDTTFRKEQLYFLDLNIEALFKLKEGSR